MQIKKILALDVHIFFTLVFRAWGILAGVVTLFAIPLFLTGIEQGYYFSFLSVIAAQVFFELGFNQVLTQIVAHEVSGAYKSGDVSQSEQFSYDRLAKLRSDIARWYVYISVAFFIAIGAAGIFFFSSKGGTAQAVWMGPWITLCLFTAGNIYVSPALAMLEGLGKVSVVAKLRFALSLIGSLSVWVALSMGAGLWAVCILPAVNFVFTSIWLNALKTPEFEALNNGAISPISWRVDIFPFQWRIALSWVSGYFIFQLFVPTVFAVEGPVGAGQIGMALTVFNALTSVGMSWVTAKSPELGRLLARGEDSAAYGLFKSVALRSIIFVTVAAFGFALVVTLGHVFHLKAVSRISNLPTLWALACAVSLNSAVFAMATYMRAYKEEPMLTQSVTIAGLMVVGVFLMRHYGSVGLSLLYFCMIAGVSLPWTLTIFKSYARRAIV